MQLLLHGGEVYIVQYINMCLYYRTYSFYHSKECVLVYGAVGKRVQ